MEFPLFDSYFMPIKTLGCLLSCSDSSKVEFFVFIEVNVIFILQKKVKSSFSILLVDNFFGPLKRTIIFIAMLRCVLLLMVQLARSNLF